MQSKLALVEANIIICSQIVNISGGGHIKGDVRPFLCFSVPYKHRPPSVTFVTMASSEMEAMMEDLLSTITRQFLPQMEPSERRAAIVSL